MIKVSPAMYKFLIPLFALALLIGCTPKTDTTTDLYGTDQASTAATEQPSTSSMNPLSASPTGFNGQMLTGMHTVVLKTSMGDITMELNADKAPKAATNFVTLSKVGYYNDLTFHRVIPGFMIQGGDPKGDGTGGESVFGPKFDDEISDLQFERGVLAMANSGPNTNGSQFFITVAATTWLQGGYTIFGKVTDGMDVVDAIAGVERDSSDRPLEPITYNVEVVQ